MLAEKVAKQIGENIVANHQHGRHEVPDDPLEDILDHEPAWESHQYGCNHNPPEQPELVFQVALPQADHECQEGEHE